MTQKKWTLPNVKYSHESIGIGNVCPRTVTVIDINNSFHKYC